MPLALGPAFGINEMFTANFMNHYFNICFSLMENGDNYVKISICSISTTRHSGISGPSLIVVTTAFVLNNAN